ncbi:MAG: Lrp/AsnC family transcriptional regulator, partial [Gammaproteobacteria bacterium]|nr:Lrp/AsnC family transcriptional regulator [Gammaproteobacteria bacterium]
MNEPAPKLNELERRLLNDYQRGFPLSSEPYAQIARELGVSEHEVLDSLASLQDRGMISRVGPVLRPNRVGSSTLAAISVPENRLEQVARYVSGYTEVN